MLTKPRSTAIKWLRNEEEKSATEPEVVLAQKLTDSFVVIHRT